MQIIRKMYILANIMVIISGNYPQMITVKPQVAQAQNINEHWHLFFRNVMICMGNKGFLL